MILFLSAVLQVQLHYRVFARQAHIELQVRHLHDLVVVHDRLVDLVFTDGDAVTYLIEAIAVLFSCLTPALMSQLLFHDFGHLSAWRPAVGTGVQQVKDGFCHLAAVNVDQLRHVLNAEHKTAAKLTRLGQRFVELRYLLQAGNLITDKPHAPFAVLAHALQQQRSQRQPHRYQGAHRLAVAGCGGNKQPTAVVLGIGHPLADAELRLTLLIQHGRVAEDGAR